MELDDELRESFVEEGRGDVRALETLLAPGLVGNAVDATSVARAADILHNLKGVTGLLGLMDMHHFALALEQTFAALRRRAAPVHFEAGALRSLLGALSEMVEAVAAEQIEDTRDIAEGHAHLIEAVASEPLPLHGGDGPVFDDSLGAVLAEEIAGLVDDALPRLEALKDDRRPAPRQHAASALEPSLSGLVNTAVMAGRQDLSDLARIITGLLRDLTTGRRPATNDTWMFLLEGMMLLRELASEASSDATEARLNYESAVAAQMAALVEGDPSSDDDAAFAEELAELRGLFLEEAREHLSTATEALESLEKNPSQGEVINVLFRATHTLKGAAATVGLDAVRDQAHALEDRFSAARDGSVPVDGTFLTEARRGLAALRDEFSRDETPVENEGETADGGRQRTVRVSLDRLDDLLVQTGELLAVRARSAEAASRLVELSRRVQRRREELTSRIEAFTLAHSYTLPAAHPGAPGGGGGLEFDEYDEVNVLARDIAELEFNLSEAVGSVTRLARDLSRDIESMAGLTERLEDGLTRVRFLPMTEVFGRYAHATRDWALADGKDVEVVIEDTVAEVDRVVADAIGEPLLHLLRNAVTHGIEATAARLARGKDAKGRIVLRARQEGRDVVIEVSDDGRGLDPGHLRDVAVHRGLLTSEEADHTPDARIVDVIFAPGFTTRMKADQMAGRGVGLDVVASTLARLGGVVSVSGEVGAGTTFSARVPASVAVLPVLTVGAGGQTFALPIAAVRETLLLDPETFDIAAGVPWRNEPLRAVDLGELIGHRPSRSDRRRRIPAVIVGHEDRNVAVIVDTLLAREEGLVKGLGPTLASVRTFAGAVVGGDGRVRLVLHVPHLLTESLGVASTAATLPEVTPSHAPRILVVDDSLSVRTAVSRALQSAGFEVEVAVDGRAAVERLEVGRFELILTDLEMPRMHGYELLAHLRATPHLAGVPALVLSSRGGKRHRDRAAALGAREFLTKPVRKEVLIERARAWLGLT